MIRSQRKSCGIFLFWQLKILLNTLKMMLTLFQSSTCLYTFYSIFTDRLVIYYCEISNYHARFYLIHNIGNIENAKASWFRFFIQRLFLVFLVFKKQWNVFFEFNMIVKNLSFFEMNFSRITDCILITKY